MLDQIASIFNQPFFIIVGGVSSLIVCGSVVYGVFQLFSGTLPVLYRIGKGLSNRKIAVFAENEYESLKDLFCDSGLFKSKNIVRIHKNSMKKAVGKDCFIVFYPEFNNELKEIIDMKNDETSLIIYSPFENGKIPDENLELINSERNSSVTNARGRLLNDIFTSMITSCFSK